QMKTNTKTVTVVDMFCGAGGMTEGHAQACRELGFKTKMIAINHWDRAIETHSLNHPEAQHYCDEMQSLDPWAVVPGGKLDLLLAGPECTHFSKARGGKPKSNQSRASAWHIVRWAEALNIRAILIENVPEFESWGPLDAHGKPIESRKGETFQAFINALKSLNYRVDWRVLNCADFGDPTTRERLFVIALKANRTIPWPDPTHSRTGEQTLFGQLPKWKAAREIVDWSLAGQSIFNRKKPLSPNTMRRIMKGLQKFGGVSFVLPPEGIHRGNAPRSVDEPLPTVTSRGGGHLVEPYLVMMYGQNDARSVDRPMPTVTAGGGHIGVAQPFIIPQQSGGSPRSVEQPLPTVAAAGAIALVQPFIMAIRGGDDGYLRASAADQPMPTLTTISPFALVEPYIVCTNHGADDMRSYPMDR
ncbi:MAG: DNA cytosine methyltransferase, partial [Planctomycetota bacterium]